MIKPGINIYKGIQQIAGDLCDFLSKKSEIKNYTLALPGGNTPKSIFEIMSHNCQEKVNWGNLLFFWGDERCVGPNHEESNYRMAYHSLLEPLKIPSTSVHRIKGEDDPIYEADRYTVEILKNVENRKGFASFNLIILGMGDDGHTASIFPGQQNIINSTRVCDISIHPVTGQKRITLTFEIINHSEMIFFLITGKNKAKIISEIIHKNGNWARYPASRVVPLTGSLCWLLDEEAASEL